MAGPPGFVGQLISVEMPTLPLALHDQTSTLAAFSSSCVGHTQPPSPCSEEFSSLPPTQLLCIAVTCCLGKEKANFSWQVLILAAELATDWPELLLCGW